MAKKITEWEKAKKDLFESKRNIFLTGPAGVGKTFLLKEYMEEEKKNGKNILVCAPTGTAAVNILGETVHSLFGIPVPCYGITISKTPAAKIKILAMADIIIVDEISMARCDVFSYMIRVLKKAEKVKGKKIRLIVSGDFSQLPPVVPKTEEKLLKKFGYHKSGYPFTTKEWEKCSFKVICLTEIKRQDDTSEFVKYLNKVRNCEKECLEYFEQFVQEDYSCSQDEILLCGTNSEAEKRNKEYLDALEGNMVAYQSEKKGRNTSGIIDDIILLKENCRVMFTVNDVIYNRYQNGTLGYITMLQPDKVFVRTDEGKLITVKPHDTKIYSYKVSGNALEKKEIGSIKQIPLKVAAAITIHKSQGKTFDKVILSPDIFASGQLYVALSRVRTPEGLILTDYIRKEHLKQDPLVEEFYKNGYKYEVPKKETKEKKTVKSTTSTTKKAGTTKKTTSKVSSAKKKSTKTAVKKKETKTIPKKKTPLKKTSISKKKTIKQKKGK